MKPLLVAVLLLAAATSARAQTKHDVAFLNLDKGKKTQATLVKVITELVASDDFAFVTPRDQLLLGEQFRILDAHYEQGLRKACQGKPFALSPQPCFELAKQAVFHHLAANLHRPPSSQARSAFSYLLLAADLVDKDWAILAAERLRALGGNIPSSLADKYQPMDATTGSPARIKLVVSAPAGSIIHVNGAPFSGQAFTTPGLTLIAVSAGVGHAQVEAVSMKADKTLDYSHITHPKSAQEITSLRQESLSANPFVIAQVMSDFSLKHLVVVQPDGQWETWIRNNSTGLAELKERQDAASAMSILASLRGTKPAMMDSRKLVQTPAPKQEKTQWWIYAVAGGAVLAATAVILGDQFKSTEQDITVTWQP